MLVLKQHAVKKGRYPEEQFAYALKQAETGTPVAEVKVPARMMVHFTACEKPREYTGRLIWAKREMEGLGIPLD